MTKIDVEQGQFKNIFDYSDRMVENRNACTDGALKPSQYWNEYIEYFQYVNYLPEHELKRIRYHTFHLNSDGYLEYILSDGKRRQQITEEYEYYAARLGFNGAEAEPAIGISYKNDGRINRDVIRYMMVLEEIREQISFPENGTAKILEIGGGYGGLARVLRTYHQNASYVICDLEETLVFSAIYLSVNFGRDKVHLVEKGADVTFEPGHFYIVAQSVLETVAFADKFDLVINQESMQEMTPATVSRYLDFIKVKARRFYTCNIDQHPDCQNTGDLVSSLNGQFEQAFGRPVWTTCHTAGWLERKARKSRSYKKLFKRFADHPAWVYNTNIIIPRSIYNIDL